MRTFDTAAVNELGAQLAGREPRFVEEPLLDHGTILWTRWTLPTVLVATDVHARLRDAMLIAHVLREREARAVERALRGTAWVRA